jgi:asparagine synthase (glutamine-hydrolysing)
MLERMSHRGEGSGCLREVGPFVTGYDESQDDRAGVYVDGMACLSQQGIDSEWSREIPANRVLRPEEISEGYRRGGPEFLESLSGPFTMLFITGEGVVMARDPFGLKPLYYAVTPGGMLAASEIKAFAGFSGTVRTFPPGHVGVPGHLTPFYSLDDTELETPPPLDQALAGFRQRMETAVRRSLDSGKKAGVLLSGGLDSSIVSAAVARLEPGVPTFVVGTRDCSDVSSAALVAQALKLEHHRFLYGLGHIEECLPDVIYHLESFDAPLVRSSVANYMAARLAREAGMEMVFCGEGGDELFAGYHYLKALERKNDVRKELRILLTQGHSGGFQRVDRMNAAHGLEPALPFMDLDVVDFSVSLPLEWKLKREGGNTTEKWFLRKAYLGALPREVVWRKKEKFYLGSGTSGLMTVLAERRVSDSDLRRASREAGCFVPSSKEELLYYRIFREFFPHRCVDLVGRTRTARVN